MENEATKKPRGLKYAKGNTSGDLANLLSATMTDVLDGSISPATGNQIAAKAGKLLVMPSEIAPRKQSRPRGTGSIYLRGKTWWISYSQNGRPFSESSRSDKQSVAEKLLRSRLADITRDEFIEPAKRKVLMLELATDFLLYYEAKQFKSYEHAKRRWELHLRPFFAFLRAEQVTSSLLDRYIAERRKQNASNGSINRELAGLHTMLVVAVRNKKLKRAMICEFPRLDESASIRQGFIEDGDRAKLLEGSELWFRAMVETGRTFGWRKTELLNLRVSQVDLLARSVRLAPGTTKNKAGRIAFLPESLYLLIRECCHGKKPDDYVFTRDGKRIVDFRRTWHNACVRAGLGHWQCRCGAEVDRDLCCPECERSFPLSRLVYRGLIFHDLRRSGVRAMVRSGISEKVAMRISGHKTRSIFDRYDICSEST